MTAPDQFETLLSRTNSSASLPYTGAMAMEESWFLTPPPCFISAGPVHMETSPLENLLIEHPSMSVYEQPVLAIRRPIATLEAVADVEDAPETEDGYLEVASAVVALPAQGNRLLANNRALVRAEVYVQQAKQGAKQAQKVNISESTL